MTKSRSDESLIRGIDEYDGDYLPLDKDRLVLFAVDHLDSTNIEPTFDKIVAATFRLFPKKFSLIGFPEYPDGRTIYYCVYNHCTITKKWLTGNVQSGFRLTERGKYFLDETRKMLEGKIRITRRYSTIARRKELTFLRSLKKTSAYRKFMNSKRDQIHESEIFDALKVRSNSEDLMQRHLKRYLEYAKRLGDEDAVKFLEFVGGRK